MAVKENAHKRMLFYLPSPSASPYSSERRARSENGFQNRGK